MQAIKFKNFSDESFTWNHDGVPYTFPAGTEMFLEDYKAYHFAKHLVDRECNKAGIPTNDPRRKEFETKCFPSDEVVTPMEAIHIEKEKEIAAKAPKVVEQEFVELEESEEEPVETEPEATESEEEVVETESEPEFEEAEEVVEVKKPAKKK